MKTRQDIERILAQEKSRLNDEFNVQSIGVFGSYARGEEQPVSDLGLPVEFD